MLFYKSNNDARRGNLAHSILQLIQNGLSGVEVSVLCRPLECFHFKFGTLVLAFCYAQGHCNAGTGLGQISFTELKS